MTEKERNDMQIMILARFILSRLLAQGAQVRIMSLDFSTGWAVVQFDPRKADAALLAALTVGVS